MSLFPTGTSADIGDIVPPDYWQKLGQLVNTSIFYNVTNPDFGAASPGASAATNTTAFQACIDAANATGTSQVIWLPGPGTYNLNSLTITKPHIFLGSGWGTELKLANSQNTYLFAFDSTAGEIRGGYMGNFKINGNAANQTTGGGCINAAGATQWKFDHLWVTAPYAAGLRLGGITAGGFGHHNRAVDCLFDGGSSSAGEGLGALINSSDENMFTRCDFEDCGGAGGTEKGGVRDEAGLNKYVQCVFVNGYEGIRVKDTGRVRIIGCTFDGCGRDSIVISGYRCVVQGNVFLEGGSKAVNTYSHIWINNDANGGNLVIGNAHTSPTAPAGNGQLRSFMRESGTADNNTVIGNRYHVDGTLGTAKVERGGAGGVWRNNNGWKTESTGTATVAAASTSITINHTLDVTPTLKDIKLTPHGTWGSTTKWWISNPTSTQFTVNVDVAPGGSGLVFGWQAQVL